MSDSPSRPIVPPYYCRECGSSLGFRSRRRNFAERYLLPILLLRPVRCGECFHRDYRSIFTPVRMRLSDTAQMPAPKPEDTSQRNVA